STKVPFPPGKGLLKSMMRTYIFLLCSIALAFPSNGVFSQHAKIHIDRDQLVSVDAVFDLLRSQTDYTSIYPTDLFKNAPLVQLEEGTIRANKLLEKCLSATEYSLDFNGNRITILPKNGRAQAGQTFTVTGRVTDGGQAPLPGANILEK